MSSSSCDAPDPDSMLSLLHECKLEGEMLHQHIAARTHTRKQTSSALQERLEEIKRISEEILDIRCVPSNIPFLPFCISRADASRIREKTTRSAGNSRELSATLDYESTARAALSTENGNYATRLSERAGELRRAQAQSSNKAWESARELPRVRSDFRKRSCERLREVTHLGWSLSVLEASL